MIFMWYVYYKCLGCWHYDEIIFIRSYRIQVYCECKRPSWLIVWQLDLQLPRQSVAITTDVVSSNLVQGKVYNIMWWSVSDLWQVSGFLWVLWFPPPIKTDRHDITEILLKVALNTIKQTNNKHYTNLDCSPNTIEIQ